MDKAFMKENEKIESDRQLKEYGLRAGQLLKGTRTPIKETYAIILEYKDCGINLKVVIPGQLNTNELSLVSGYSYDSLRIWWKILN